MRNRIFIIKGYLFVSVVFNLTHIDVFSQQIKYVHVTGVVLDKTTKTPVPSVNIFLKKSSIGTFSNELGEFSLSIPDSLISDTLALSSIGYKTCKEKLSSLDLTKSHTFYLEESEILLAEVVVKASGTKAEELAEKALKKLPRNMTSKQYLLQAFYRELSLRDSTYVRLIEAAVEMQDFGYGSSLDKRKIKVVELRKSEDYIAYGWGTKVSKMLFGDDNMLYKTVDADFLRNYKLNQMLAPIDKQPFLDEYNFELNGYTSLDSDSLAIVSFSSDNTNHNRPYYEGKLYINLTDFGIARMEYGMVANPGMAIRAQSDVFYQGKFFFKTTVDYRRIDTKYFLSRVVFIKPQNFDAVENGKGQQYTVFDFAVNNTVTSKKEFDRIKKKESQKQDIDLYSQSFTYNALFWSDYNMVKLNPLLKKAQVDLEKGKNLENQFKGNSKD